MDDGKDGKCPDKDVCFVEGVRLGKCIMSIELIKCASKMWLQVGPKTVFIVNLLLKGDMGH